MVEKKTWVDRLFDGINFVFLGAFALICIYPLYYVLCASLSDPVAFAKNSGPLIIPLGFTFSGYHTVFSNPNILIGYGNTLFYVIIGTLIRMILTTMGAYVLAQRRFMLRKLVTILCVFTMYFSGGLIPTYLLVNQLGMVNTRWALIIPTAITCWNMIILKTSFQSIPASLVESGYLDGATDPQILLKIVLPVSKASISVIILYYVVAEWGSWFQAAIYLSSCREYYPLQLVLREILNSGTNTVVEANGSASASELLLQEIAKYAGISIATLPIICLYPFIQKYFEKGIMMGSVKG